MARTKAKNTKAPDVEQDAGWQDAQMPLSSTIEGWWDRRIGDVLHATIIGSDESQYGMYFIAKLRAPVRVKTGDEEPRMATPGTTVAFSYNAIWRDVSKALTRGPVEVRTSPLAEGSGKAKFAYSVQFRPAF